MASVLVQFLAPETTIRGSGAGPMTALHDSATRTFLLTVGVTEVIEQESLSIDIAGSEDGSVWLSPSVAAFPPKFYSGVSSLLLDLSARPEIRYIRAEWKTDRWGRGDKTPLFRFYVFIEEAPVTAG